MTARTATTALLALLGAALLLVALAGPASAHASLEGGSISDGQVLDVGPEEIFLEFNEPVTAARGGLRVHDGDGARVDVGGTFQTDDAPELVRVAVRDDLPEGTYAVTYRVVSADGHPVNGAFLFSVGAEAGSGDALLGQVFSSTADRPWAIAATLFRWIMYAGTLLAAGAAVTAAWMRRTLVGDGVPAARLTRRAAWAAVAASAVGVLLQNVLVSGDGVAGLVDVAGLAAVLGSFVGISALVRIAGLVLLVVALRRAASALGGPLALGGAGLALLSLLLEGHTLTTEPAVLVWTAGAVHVATAATWFGGLAVLALELRDRRRADDPVAAGRLVARFSSLFTISVVAVVLAGSALSWAEVRALRALTSTTYGWVLVAKLATVVPLLALGLYNNRRLVPALTARRRARASSSASQPAIAGGSSEVADAASTRDAAWTHLRRTVRIEVAVVAVVLALTSALVAIQPAAEAAGITGAFSTTQPFEGVGQMTVTVDPNRAGRNEIHIYLLSDVGRPIDVGEEDAVTMRLSQRDLDIGPIVREATYAGRGHYIVAGPELSVPGRWEITTEVALTRFDVATTVTEITVNP